MPEDSLVTVTDITTQQEINRRKEQELKGKRAKIKAFQGLPPVSFHSSFPRLVGLKLRVKPLQNLELARHELQNARSELTKLLHLRERLLGRMADGVP
jgi:HAUS augmin-like complex subunit 1